MRYCILVLICTVAGLRRLADGYCVTVHNILADTGAVLLADNSSTVLHVDQTTMRSLILKALLTSLILCWQISMSNANEAPITLRMVTGGSTSLFH